LHPLYPPPPPPTVAGPRGSITEGVDKVDISNNNREFGYGPARIRIKKGTTVTWTNLGDLPHTATEVTQRMWDTGDLVKGASKAITFNEPGNYYYICTPHPWMYGQIIVEN
jgi:plastocyanin